MNPGGKPSRPGRQDLARPNLRGLVLDLSPLRDLRDYRLLWAGQSVNVIGNR